MSLPIIEIKGLSKEYKINAQNVPYLSLRDSIFDLFRKSKKENKDKFWALNNVSFDIQPGDSVAIIGRNGAGKSTLLKILSKITPPSKGEIVCRGRVASLLEVGTGFHPELTGKENVYLNGSILGLSKTEIDASYEEIVDFAEIRKFLDTPLKHYSSGMQLRLAFAVAAHLNPEILVIDEVLAVGDSMFQKKCIDKMTAVSQSGRTVIFVSHNLSAIRALCNKAVVLDKGKKVFEGDVDQAIQHYQSHRKVSSQKIDLKQFKPYGSPIRNLIFDTIEFPKSKFNFGEDISFKLKLQSVNGASLFKNIELATNIMDQHNNCLIHACNLFIHKTIDHKDDKQEYIFSIKNNLKPGIYSQTLFLRSDEGIQDWIMDSFTIEIEEGNPYNFENTAAIQGSVFTEFSINQTSES